MQASTVSPVTNSTVPSNATKTKEQILIQSSGAMIALIVVGIIIILAILLIILKTYNRYTHASRVLGARGSKPRPKMSQSTTQSSVPLTGVHVSSVSNSIHNTHTASENGFRLPSRESSMMEGNHIEQSSTNSGSTVVTIHGPPSDGNT